MTTALLTDTPANKDISLQSISPAQSMKDTMLMVTPDSKAMYRVPTEWQGNMNTAIVLLISIFNLLKPFSLSPFNSSPTLSPSPASPDHYDSTEFYLVTGTSHRENHRESVTHVDTGWKLGRLDYSEEDEFSMLYHSDLEFQPCY